MLQNYEKLILVSNKGEKCKISNCIKSRKIIRRNEALNVSYSIETSFLRIESGRSITADPDKIFAQTLFEGIDKG